jgi:hypothetical protein
MKKAGIIVLIVGLVITLLTGFRFVTREKLVNIGKLEISARMTHSIAWSPIIGVTVIAIGAGLYLLGTRNSTSM